MLLFVVDLEGRNACRATFIFRDIVACIALAGEMQSGAAVRAESVLLFCYCRTSDLLHFRSSSSSSSSLNRVCSNSRPKGCGSDPQPTKVPPAAEAGTRLS